jgi:hypothetical protein
VTDTFLSFSITFFHARQNCCFLSNKVIMLPNLVFGIPIYFGFFGRCQDDERGRTARKLHDYDNNVNNDNNDNLFFFQTYIIYNIYSRIPFTFIFCNFSTPNIWALVAPMYIIYTMYWLTSSFFIIKKYLL